MKYTVTVALMVAVLASGCGARAQATHPVGPPKADVTAAGPVILKGPGPFEGGVDIPTGVYVAKGASCSANTAKTRAYDANSTNPDDSQFIEGSAQVRDVARVVVNRGEFLSVSPNCRWRREDGSGPRTPDPATLAGGCTILVSDGLVTQTVMWLLSPRHDKKTGDDLQQRLWAVVFSESLARGPHTRALYGPAGSMVDFIDAPAYFVSGATLDPKVTQAVAAINKACGH